MWLLFGLLCTVNTCIVTESRARVRKTSDTMMRAETHPHLPETADDIFIVAGDGVGRVMHTKSSSHLHQIPETYIVASDGSVVEPNETPLKVEDAVAAHEKAHQKFDPDFVRMALVGVAHQAPLATGHLGMDWVSTERYTTTMPVMGTMSPIVMTTTAGALDYQATTALPMFASSTTALANDPSMTVSPYSVTALPTTTAAGVAAEGSASSTSWSQSWLAYILAVAIIICLVASAIIFLVSRSKKSSSSLGRPPQLNTLSTEPTDAEAWKASRKLQSYRKSVLTAMTSDSEKDDGRRRSPSAGAGKTDSETDRRSSRSGRYRDRRSQSRPSDVHNIGDMDDQQREKLASAEAPTPADMASGGEKQSGRQGGKYKDRRSNGS